MLVGAVLLVLLAAGAFYLFRALQPAHTASTQPATIPATAASQATAVSAQVDSQIRKLFQNWLTAANSGDTRALAALIDGRRLIAEIQRCGVLADLTKSNADRLADFIATDLAKRVVGNPNAQFGRSSIDKITALANRNDQAVLYFRGWNSAGLWRYRFFLRHTGDAWKVFDIQELNFGPRISQAMAPNAQIANNQPVPDWGREMLTVGQAMDRGDNIAVAQALASKDPAQFPPAVQAIIIANKAQSVRDPKPEDTLRLVDQAQALDPDIPMLHLLRAAACNELKRPQDAIRAAQHFIDIAGEHPLAFGQLGLAYEALGDRPQARTCFRQGLIDDPTETCAKGLNRLKGK